MTEPTPVVDFSTLEREKENITANRDGHSALALQQTFSVPRNQRQQQLAATKAQFNRELEQALRDSDDPLDAFVRFVQWTLDSYPSGKSSDSGLTPLLELATRTFKDEPQYKYDRRYLNLWLQYANLVAKPQLIFAHLLANDIGSVFTLLYVEYANVLERLGQRSKADEIYRLGIARKAKPSSLLDERYNEFQARMLSAKPDGLLTLESGTSPSAAPIVGGRKVLGESRASRGQGQSGPSAASQLPTAVPSRPGNGSNKGKFAVFSDADAGPADYTMNDWNKLQGQAARDKENSADATAWQGEKLHQRGVAQTPKTPRFTVLRDDEDSDAPMATPFKTPDAIHIRAPSEKPPTEAELLFNDPFKNWIDPPSESINAEPGPSTSRGTSASMLPNTMPPPSFPKSSMSTSSTAMMPPPPPNAGKGKGPAASQLPGRSEAVYKPKPIDWRDRKYPQPRAFVPDDEIPAVSGQPKRKPEVTHWKLYWNEAEKKEYSIAEVRAKHLGLLGKKWPPPPIIQFEVTKMEDGSTRSRQITNGRQSIAREPTVTINTKFAMNDVFDMFNGEGEADEGDSFDDGGDADDGAGPLSMATPVAAMAMRGSIQMNMASRSENVPPSPTPYSRSVSTSDLGEQTPSVRPKAVAATPKFTPFVDPPSGGGGLGSSSLGMGHPSSSRTPASTAGGLGRSASGPTAATPRFTPFVDPPANRIVSATPKFTPFVDPPQLPPSAPTPKFKPFVDPPNPKGGSATPRFTSFADPAASTSQAFLTSQKDSTLPLPTRTPLAATGTRATPAFRPFADADAVPPVSPSPTTMNGAVPRQLIADEGSTQARPSLESLGSNNIFGDVKLPPPEDAPQKKVSISPPRRLSLDNIFSSGKKFPINDVFTTSTSNTKKSPALNTSLFPDIEFIPSPDPTEELDKHFRHPPGRGDKNRRAVQSQSQDQEEHASEPVLEVSVPLPAKQGIHWDRDESSDEGDYDVHGEHQQEGEEDVDDHDGQNKATRWRFGRGMSHFDAFNEMTPITERTYEFTRTSSASDFASVGRRSSVAARHLGNELSKLQERDEENGFEEHGGEGDTSMASVAHPETRRPRQSVARPRQSIAPPPESDEPPLPNPCNPFDDYIVEQLLQLCSVPFVDRRNETCGQLERLQRFGAKKMKASTDKRKSYSAGETMYLTLGEDKFVIQAKLGEGGFGAVFLAAVYDESSGNVDEDTYVALKAVKPCQIWEYTILSHIRGCLDEDSLMSIIAPETLYAFADESYLVIDHCAHGTLLDCVNKAVLTEWGSNGGTGMTEVLVMFFSVELFRVVEGLHRVGFIHGDLKIDNCLARFSLAPGGMSAWSNRYDPSGENGWSLFGIRLIDFGRAIDTTMFPDGQTFKGDWPTDARDCVEMREGRAWTYETDYFGLAGIIYCMLHAKYIETASTVDPETGAVRYQIATPFKRYWNVDLWRRAFDVLLNPHTAREDGTLPIIDEMRPLRGEMEQWLVENCTKGKRSLKQMLKTMSMWDESSEDDPRAWATNVLEELAAPDAAYTPHKNASPTAIPDGVHHSDDPPADSPSRPSCRLIVVASDFISKTSVVIVDVHDTVMVGRDRQPAPHIRLKEMMVSKHHAYIFWDDATAGWSIVDNGSVHGTFVTPNDTMNTSTTSPTRLSPARTASLPRSLQHGDRVNIGSTTFEMHIHQDGQPCATCGATDAGKTHLVVVDEKHKKKPPPTDPKSGGQYVNQEKEDPKVTMQRLRKNLLSRSSYQPSSTKRPAPLPAPHGESSSYVDRAKKRRYLNVDYGPSGPEAQLDTPGLSSSVGAAPLPARRYHQVMSKLRQVELLGEQSMSSVPHLAVSNPPHGTSTPASQPPLDGDNIGHRLLVKQGWRQGEGLRSVDEPDRSALVEPLQVRMLEHRAGLGSRR
ncbi:hypothetical protein FRB98_009600 [Tulasnella sp. 332]|nr:hypothetical protein FRB98_009600 [Tulasnella sp. 332]